MSDKKQQPEPGGRGEQIQYASSRSRSAGGSFVLVFRPDPSASSASVAVAASDRVRGQFLSVELGVFHGALVAHRPDHLRFPEDDDDEASIRWDCLQLDDDEPDLPVEVSTAADESIGRRSRTPPAPGWSRRSPNGAAPCPRRFFLNSFLAPLVLFLGSHIVLLLAMCYLRTKVEGTEVLGCDCCMNRGVGCWIRLCLHLKCAFLMGMGHCALSSDCMLLMLLLAISAASAAVSYV